MDKGQPSVPQYFLTLTGPLGGIPELLQDVPVPVPSEPEGAPLVPASEADQTATVSDNLVTATTVEALVDGGKAM